MKDWFKYIVASVAGLALVILLPATDLTEQLIQIGSDVFNNLGRYLLIPFILVSTTAGIASIRRQQHGFKALIFTVGWGLAATAALTVVSGIISWQVLTASFSGISASTEITPPVLLSLPDFLDSIIKPNVLSFLTESYSILPVLLFSLLLGVVLKPEEDFIRPAFAVMNSFSEAFYKLARIITELMILGLVFISAAWFAKTVTTGLLQDSLRLLFMIGVVTAVSLFLILPTLLVFIGKTKKPFTWMFALVAPALLGFFSGSSYTAQPTLMLHARNNLGAAKRICSTSSPILLVIGRSGTAAVSAVTVITLFSTVYGDAMPFMGVLMTIGLSIVLSLTVITAPGVEILLIVSMVGSIIGVDLGTNLAIILPVLPLLAGVAALIDVIAAGFGIGAVSRMLQAHSPVLARDFL